jgi:hypothetical protein
MKEAGMKLLVQGLSVDKFDHPLHMAASDIVFAYPWKVLEYENVSS